MVIIPLLSIILVIGVNNMVIHVFLFIVEYQLIRFFHKGLLAIAFDKYGSEELLEKDPINHLFEIYVKINVS
jgi:hypothetical protein